MENITLAELRELKNQYHIGSKAALWLWNHRRRIDAPLEAVLAKYVGQDAPDLRELRRTHNVFNSVQRIADYWGSPPPQDLTERVRDSERRGQRASREGAIFADFYVTAFTQATGTQSERRLQGIEQATACYLGSRIGRPVLIGEIPDEGYWQEVVEFVNGRTASIPFWESSFLLGLDEVDDLHRRGAEEKRLQEVDFQRTALRRVIELYRPRDIEELHFLASDEYISFCVEKNKRWIERYLHDGLEKDARC